MKFLVYAIMCNNEVISTHHIKWKAQEYCDILNANNGINDYYIIECIGEK